MTECIQESFTFTAHFSRRVQAEFTAAHQSRGEYMELSFHFKRPRGTVDDGIFSEDQTVNVKEETVSRIRIRTPMRTS